MATLSKKCPRCKGKRPVEVQLCPESETNPSTRVAYKAVCLSCGYVYPPDFKDHVSDATAWAEKNRARIEKAAAKEG